MIEKIVFCADHLQLSGTLHLPDAPLPPVIIGCHGLLSSGDSPKQQALAERLNCFGIAYFRFDHRGCGMSQGDFREVTTFSGRCNDLAAALLTAISHPGIGRPVGLFGSSMGGAVCLAMAPEFDIRTVVTLAAPVRFSSIQLPAGIEADPQFRGMNMASMAFDVSDRLGCISNILVVHGDADRVVSFRSAEEIMKKAAHPKRLLRLEGADHPLSLPAHQQEFMTQTANWFTSHLISDGYAMR